MDNYAEAIRFARAFWREKVQAEGENNILVQDMGATCPTEAEMARMGDALERAARDPDTNDYDVLVMVAAGLLRENEKLPGWLASFAADALEGKRKRPTKPGADKYRNWQRDYSLWRAVDAVADKFDLPRYTNNELSRRTTAAEIVAEAAGLAPGVVTTAYRAFSRGENNPRNFHPR